MNGIYILSGGVRTGHFSAAASGQRVTASILQTGGTNAASAMDFGPPNQFGGGVMYTLSNGVVRVDSSTTFERRLVLSIQWRADDRFQFRHARPRCGCRH